MTDAGASGTTAPGGTAEIAASPFDPATTFAETLVAPFGVGPLSPGETWAILGVLAVLVGLACVAFRRVGVTPLETLALLVVAPLFAHVDHNVWQMTANATLAFNVAGFLVPALVAFKMVVDGRAPFFGAVFVLIAGTAASYFSSYAVPNEGVLLYYRMPAIVAAGLALLVARGRAEAVGPLAYVSGAGGVILGADALRINELLVSTDPHRIVVGGAGVLDGIFLVGLLALVLAALAQSALVSFGVAKAPAPRGEERREPTPAPAGARDVGGLG